MLTRRQLLVNSICAGVTTQALADHARTDLLHAPKLRQISMALDVHESALRSVLDRFHEELPHIGTVIYGNSENVDACTFETEGNARFDGRWRLQIQARLSTAEQSLGRTIGLGCMRLTPRLNKGAALSYRVGLHLGGVRALLYEGLNTRVCLLSRDLPQVGISPALFINA